MDADPTHRAHAVVEQAFADLNTPTTGDAAARTRPPSEAEAPAPVPDRAPRSR